MLHIEIISEHVLMLVARHRTLGTHLLQESVHVNTDTKKTHWHAHVFHWSPQPSPGWYAKVNEVPLPEVNTTKLLDFRIRLYDIALLLLRHAYSVSPPQLVTFSNSVVPSIIPQTPAAELLTDLRLPDTITIVVLHEFHQANYLYHKSDNEHDGKCTTAVGCAC